MSKLEPRYRFATSAGTLAALAAAVITTLITQPSSARGEEIPAYALRQVSQTYGPIEATVSSAGLRMSISTCIVTMPMPCDTMMFKNTRTKYFFDQSVKRFKAKIPIRVSAEEDQKVIYIDSKKIVGLPVKHYKWVKWKRKNPKKQVIIYEFWATRALPIPDQVCEVANICTYLPVNYGFPLRISGRRSLPGRPEGEEVVFLSTQSIRKVTAEKKSFVSDSRGFERVNNEMAVLLKERTAASEEDVSDLFKPNGMK